MISIIQEFTAKLLLGTFDFLVAKCTANKPILFREDIPFHDILIDNHKVFLEDYLNIARQKKINDIKDFYKIKKDFNEDDKWRAEPLILYNYLFKENAERCKNTIDIVSKIPGCHAAMFSILEPGKYIPSHTGIYKGIYRCLYTLQLSEENANCWIRIQSEKIYFKEGEFVMFDETAEHELHNASSKPRIALYLDIYRKLPFPLDLYNKLIYFIIRRSPFVQNILKSYKQLENATIISFVPAEPVLK